MAKHTSLVLGDHFEQFINGLIASGHYRSVSEVIGAGLCLLEERERRIGTLRQALIEGERSDLGDLDIHNIKRTARRRGAAGD